MISRDALIVLWLKKQLPRLWRRLLQRMDRRLAKVSPAVGGGGSPGPKGDPGDIGPKGDPGAAGHSPVVAFGTTQATADRLTIDGVVTGPHLTGPAGQTPDVVFGSGASADQIIINGSLYSPHLTGPAGPPGTTDHGSQQGLGDDDHPQYYNQTRGDARYLKRGGDLASGPLTLLTQATGTLADGAGDAPFELRAGANAGDAYMLFHSPAMFAQKFGMDAAGDLYVGSYSRGAARHKVWRWGDHLLRNEQVIIAAGAMHAFSVRNANVGAALYALVLWQGTSALFVANYMGSGGGPWTSFDTIYKGSGVMYGVSYIADKIVVFMDASYRINVINGVSYAVTASLFSVSP